MAVNACEARGTASSGMQSGVSATLSVSSPLPATLNRTKYDKTLYAADTQVLLSATKT